VHKQPQCAVFPNRECEIELLIIEYHIGPSTTANTPLLSYGGTQWLRIEPKI
jgi:hypothetical protein